MDIEDIWSIDHEAFAILIDQDLYNPPDRSLPPTPEDDVLEVDEITTRDGHPVFFQVVDNDVMLPA